MAIRDPDPLDSCLAVSESSALVLLADLNIVFAEVMEQASNWPLYWKTGGSWSRHTASDD